LTVSTEDMIDHLLKLPVEDRIRIADVLLQSLHPGTEPEIEAAWIEEIERRHEALLTGASKPLAGAEVVAELRARLQR